MRPVTAPENLSAGMHTPGVAASRPMHMSNIPVPVSTLEMDVTEVITRTGSYAIQHSGQPPLSRYFRFVPLL
jgi:hypothetical protein